MVYEDENHQFCTVVKINDKGAALKNDLWGTFFTKRFDGSIDWDGAWRKNLKPGDKIPVFRDKRGDTYAYITGFDLCTTKEKLIDYINRPEQEAVVTSVVQKQKDIVNDETTEIQAYSPVWKDIYYESYGMIDVRRGDIVVFSREEKGAWDYEYRLVENKTQEEIKNKGIAKILKDFTEAERNRLLLLSDGIRMGIIK